MLKRFCFYGGFFLSLSLLILCTPVLAEQRVVVSDPPSLPANKKKVLDESLNRVLPVRTASATLKRSADSTEERLIVSFSKAGIRRLKRRSHTTRFRDQHVMRALFEIQGIRKVHAFRSNGVSSFSVRANRRIDIERMKERGFIDYHSDIPLEMRETTPNDAYFGLQWAHRNSGQTILTPGDGGVAGVDVKSTIAWDHATGVSAVVAVADTGIELSHPDLAANIWTNPREIAGNNIDDDANGWVDDSRGANAVYYDGTVGDQIGHGTEVSGVIAARANNAAGVAGMAFNSKILPIKIADDSGLSYVSDWVVALDYARMMRVRYNDTNPSNGGANIQVFNLSSGAAADCTPTGNPAHPLDLFLSTARAAEQAGILIVSAVSNDAINHDVVPDFPTSCNLTNLLTVANIDNKGALNCLVPLQGDICPAGTSHGSGYGATSVDIAAPGTNIATTGLGASYVVANGTSFAAPLVSGVAALIAGSNPSLSPSSIRTLIIGTANKLPSLNNKVLADGMLDARAAIPNILTLLPGFTAQPQSLSVTSGSNANFSVTASGASPRTYQWYKNDLPIANATGSSYQITGVTSANSGSYRCKVSNAYGSAMSVPASLTVTSGTAPVFTTHPANKSLVAGQSSTLSCAASGNPLPTYQWQKSGINISGATQPTYTLTASLSDHGKVLRCVATNSAGSAVSNGALITVTPRGDFTRDGCVNGSDYLFWQREYGKAGIAAYSGADGNGDGRVDAADYTIWRNNYGTCR